MVKYSETGGEWLGIQQKKKKERKIIITLDTVKHCCISDISARQKFSIP
jgi:hypothetical protein